MTILRPFVYLSIVLAIALAQDYAEDEYYSGDFAEYPDYAQDGNPDDYAPTYDERKSSGAVWTLPKLLLSMGGTWICSAHFNSKRAKRHMKAVHQTNQKAAYSQYYNDIYKLTNQKDELQSQIEQLQNSLKDVKDKAEMDQIQRDYEEFKQPDIDGDDRISRAEFNLYVKNYLSNYPGLKEKDYPKFEDFDRDGDGYVGFQEYASQMAIAVEKAERDATAEQETASSSSSSTVGSKYSSGQGYTFEELYGEYS
eukprot:CAMPEP_0194229540 /NCGR_PEP_ID=MMETSP0156-20130528/43944_1 /TAXON_ID=33649 /ORGANISM="Thalassionema nitzschioides, Strain L26-B" /LENGTH=252 /DNA_ID=CAMNT_0038962093 /DNA_START=28 /DNA_END=786 /DNA_ORIENTATION=+